jgi:hypothetical protein
VPSPTYLTVDEVVERYRCQISEGTLRNWRALRIGPSYAKVPLYPVEELDRWDQSNLVLCRQTRSSQLEEA